MGRISKELLNHASDHINFGAISKRLPRKQSHLTSRYKICVTSLRILIIFVLVTDPAAALSSIMVFLSLDTEPIMARTTGWSKIPGEQAGEWKATS